jgi:hypothetical protein
MFSAFLQDFFVDETDSVHTRQMKLEIITYLATESNISKILREFNVCIGVASSLSLSLSVCVCVCVEHHC